ncbi:auxin-induced protein 15a [Phtheirospermum japonicum]|uniref:Auxin-induced protein 15a n=1 Tax=Phtheirospermum japonicum TaxID=374723 RepID=A0A830C1K9_9LAMI|nr:auxin-induced protein 15a [Phtheirospermum japonicum]
MGMVIKDVPKGCLAIKVGAQDEEAQRMIIPVMYFNHPLFMQLLKAAEEEYGFEQKGTITIPCRLDHFRCVQRIIDNQQQQHGAHYDLIACFRVWHKMNTFSCPNHNIT